MSNQGQPIDPSKMIGGRHAMTQSPTILKTIRVQRSGRYRRDMKRG